MGRSQAVHRSRPETAEDAFATRLYESALASADLLTIYLGERLGLYGPLARQALTAAQLARLTGTDARYVREWLEQQAVTGILELVAPADDPERRRYRLPRAHAESLLDGDSLRYLAPLARMNAAAAMQLPALARAFRTGRGVAYSRYGADASEGQAALSRPGFLQLLGALWIPSLPELDARLRAEPAARAADVGCGAGWAAIGLAEAYPRVCVEGFDLHDPAIRQARRNAAERGLRGRVKFRLADGSRPSARGRFDLVTCFETLHEMAHPVEALRTMRSMLREEGFLLVAEPRADEPFQAPGSPVQRMLYAASVLSCLPTVRATRGSAATGGAVRPSVLFGYAERAGCTEVQLLPVEHPAWQFYRLI